jgi:hypothetical protein
MVTTLEKIKQNGAYAINVTFGEGIGCDDSDVPTNDRGIICIYTPVGCLGSNRVMWKGKYSDFIKFDFSSKPEIISNPPKREEYENGGFFIWGADLKKERAADTKEVA